MLVLDWQCLFFDDLTIQQLYAIGQLRQAVFVVEQNCPYLDLDGKDKDCWHLGAWDEQQQLVAYARICPKGIAYPNDIAIGRVVTAANARRHGLGRLLMQKAISYALTMDKEQHIRLSAQDYLLDFYKSLGFEATPNKYLEDGIAHTEMYWKAPDL